MVLLGKKIKELRNKYKYTQTELATLVGVTKSTIAAYENDTRLPSYEVLIKLSHIFKVSLDYLMLDRQMDSVNIHGLNSEQIGAIQNLISYYRNSRISIDYTMDFPDGKGAQTTLLPKQTIRIEKTTN